MVFLATESHWCVLAGADVTHSRSFDSTEPSVAAVVGSLNRFATRYSCRVKIQGHRQEMIQVRSLLGISNADVNFLNCSQSVC